MSHLEEQKYCEGHGYKIEKATKKMYVPSEVVREIFLSLPCKSLCRFRYISKQYRSYVNDHQFMEEHRKRNMKASHLLIWGVGKPPNVHLFNMSIDSFTHIKTIPTYKYEFMISSSYGMVCLHGWESWDITKIALFNPSSEEIIPLPGLAEPFEVETKNEPCTTFDDEDWHDNDCLGFGFDPKSRRYKCIQLTVRDLKLSRFHVLTVTRSNSTWRTVDVSSKPLVCLYCYQHPICVDGVIYWEIWIAEEELYVNVLAFDLGTEEMKIIQSPAKAGFHESTVEKDIYGYRGHLALLEGALCCYQITPLIDSLMMTIWKLEYDVNDIVNWTLCYKFEIDSSEIDSFYPDHTCLFPLYIYDGKWILFQDQYLEEFYCYDIEAKCLKIYPLVGEIEGLVDDIRSVVYSEALSYPLD